MVSLLSRVSGSFNCHVAPAASLPIDATPSLKLARGRITRFVRPILSCTADMPLKSEERQTVRIAIVGDIHSFWNLKEDERALKKINPDLVLFVGDFGDECEEISKSIGELDLPKAVILGNHDYWLGPASVKCQVESLKGSHVGFSRLDCPELSLAVVGGRPGSRGGSEWRNSSHSSPSGEGDHAWMGIRNFEESAEKIIEEAMGAPEDFFLIFLAHNGPQGLGDKRHSICGRDWPRGGQFVGGDHGDPDFAKAIKHVIEKGRRVPAVVFGHMHKVLHKGNPNFPAVQHRIMLEKIGNTNFVNSAVVPRVRLSRKNNLGNPTIGNDFTFFSVNSPPSQRHFTVMEIDKVKKEVVRVQDVWVDVDEKVEVFECIDRFNELVTNVTINSVGTEGERYEMDSTNVFVR